MKANTKNTEPLLLRIADLETQLQAEISARNGWWDKCVSAETEAQALRKQCAEQLSTLADFVTYYDAFAKGYCASELRPMTIARLIDAARAAIAKAKGGAS